MESTKEIIAMSVGLIKRYRTFRNITTPEEFLEQRIKFQIAAYLQMNKLIDVLESKNYNKRTQFKDLEKNLKELAIIYFSRNELDCYHDNSWQLNLKGNNDTILTVNIENILNKKEYSEEYEKYDFVFEDPSSFNVLSFTEILKKQEIEFELPIIDNAEKGQKIIKELREIKFETFKKTLEDPSKEEQKLYKSYDAVIKKIQEEEEDRKSVSSIEGSNNVKIPRLELWRDIALFCCENDIGKDQATSYYLEIAKNSEILKPHFSDNGGKYSDNTIAPYLKDTVKNNNGHRNLFNNKQLKLIYEMVKTHYRKIGKNIPTKKFSEELLKEVENRS